MDCRKRIRRERIAVVNNKKKNKHPNTRQLCSTRGREKKAALVSLRIFEKKERKVGRHGGSRDNRYKYTRVIFEGRDAYLCGGAGRARERKDKRNRLVSGGGSCRFSRQGLSQEAGNARAR